MNTEERIVGIYEMFSCSGAICVKLQFESYFDLIICANIHMDQVELKEKPK